MSLFLIYDADAAEYLLQPAGYVLMVLLLAALLAFAASLGSKQSEQRMSAKKLVFCAMAIALATVTSFLKLAPLPFGGSIALYRMLFIVLIGYFYGARTGLITGIAYGVLNLITGPYIYAPLQVLLDYPLAFGALGLSGFFAGRKNGLATGYTVGVVGRYLFHVLSGYVFFAEYAPEGMNALLYTLLYNLTYILPELIATLVVLQLPAIQNAISQVKRQAI